MLEESADGTEFLQSWLPKGIWKVHTNSTLGMLVKNS